MESNEWCNPLKVYGRLCHCMKYPISFVTDLEQHQINHFANSITTLTLLSLSELKVYCFAFAVWVIFEQALTACR